MYLVAWHAVLCGAQQLVADRWRRDRREAGFGAETVARRLHSRLYHLHWPREECGIISCLQLGSFDAVLGYATGPQEVGVLETCNGAPGQKIIWRPLFFPWIHTYQCVWSSHRHTWTERSITSILKVDMMATCAKRCRYSFQEGLRCCYPQAQGSFVKALEVLVWNYHEWRSFRLC